MILFCNIVYVYVHKIGEKFGGCKKSLSWLDQKLKQKDRW